MKPIVDLMSLSTAELIQIIRLRPPKWSLFTTFFKRQSPSEREVFEIHTKIHGQNAIPIVSNYSAGVMRQPEGWGLNQVKAPRFRTIRSFRAADVMFKRQIGTNPYDLQGDPFAQALAEDLDGHRQDHDYMLEIMCAQAAVEGKVTLFNYDNGQMIPKQIIDYQRPASHTINLSGSDKWSSSSSDLVTQIEEANRMIMESCNGMAATDLIMGTKAWNTFRKHADVKDVIDNNFRIDGGSHINLQIGSLNRGSWNGITLWIYNGWYLDVDNTKKNYIDTNSALLIARSAENVIEYARPVDLDCSGATDYFVKSFKQDEPSGIFTVAESRPLPICYYPAWSVLFKNVA